MMSKRIRLSDVVGIPPECACTPACTHACADSQDTLEIGVVLGLRLGSLALTSTSVPTVGRAHVEALVNGRWVNASDVHVFDAETREYIERALTTEYAS